MDEAAPHAGLFLLDAGTDGGGHGVRLDASALADWMRRAPGCWPEA